MVVGRSRTSNDQGLVTNNDSRSAQLTPVRDKFSKKYVSSTTPPAPVDVIANPGRIDLPCDVFPNPQ